ncbi:MAG TPA: cyanophycin synthetase [Ktedonobacterales bacterium]
MADRADRVDSVDTAERVGAAERDLHLLERVCPEGVRGRRIHFIGVGGSGISSALWLAGEHGAVVSGCDIAATSSFKLLASRGMEVTLGHAAEHLEGADLVAVSPFLTYRHPDLPELVAARERGIPIAKWQALLGFLMRGRAVVSVAGVHGKGSTTALIGSLAARAGLDPTVEVGATSIEWGLNSRLGHSDFFINEADEWDHNFLHYHPRVAVLTAVEYDHPEYYRSYDEIRDAFVAFLRGMDFDARAGGRPPDAPTQSSAGGHPLDAPTPTLVINADSEGCRDVLARVRDLPLAVTTFGLERDDADVRGEEVVVGAETSFVLRLRGVRLGHVTLSTPGRTSVYNAVAAAAAASALGVPAEQLVAGLGAWPGLRRRFEIVPDGDVTFVDDYAHHPHAVALALETARARFPGRRIVAVFQPTLFTRLHRFLTPFSEAFDAADQVVIVEIQPSREADTGLIHGSALSDAIAARPHFAARPGSSVYGGDFTDTAALLRKLRRPGDVIVVMGSGPVNQVIAGVRES